MEVFDLQNETKKIRIWFQKLGKIRFISHLDLNRCILHALKCSKIPVFYTQGFHPHIFVSFASPLSLGIEGQNECFDIKLLKPFDLEEIPKKLNPWLPEGLKITAAKPPQNDPKSIKFADFLIKIAPKKPSKEDDIFSAEEKIKNILKENPLIIEKRTKSSTKAINLASEIKRISINSHPESPNNIEINITLPAGNQNSINPNLITNLLKDRLGFPFFFNIFRTAILNDELKMFC